MVPDDTLIEAQVESHGTRRQQLQGLPHCTALRLLDGGRQG